MEVQKDKLILSYSKTEKTMCMILSMCCIAKLKRDKDSGIHIHSS